MNKDAEIARLRDLLEKLSARLRLHEQNNLSLTNKNQYLLLQVSKLKEVFPVTM